MFVLINLALFSLFNVSLKQLLKFKSKVAAKKDIKQVRREKIIPKKLNYFEKRKVEATEVLKQSNMDYSSYQKIVGLCAFIGLAIGLLMDNILLSFVLAAGLAYAPIQYLKFKQIGYTNMLNEQLETALAIITNTYIQVEDIIKAISDNLKRLDNPLLSIMKEFLAETNFIDANIVKALLKMKSKINNNNFHDWCDILIQCQEDRELKYVLPSIVDKMSDIKKIQLEFDTIMYNYYKDYISVTLVVVANIPLMYFLNKDWFTILTTTLSGKLVIAITCAVIFIATAYVIKVNKPVSIS
jgi:Flp pilus assembly protein TadB